MTESTFVEVRLTVKPRARISLLKRASRNIFSFWTQPALSCATLAVGGRTQKITWRAVFIGLCFHLLVSGFVFVFVRMRCNCGSCSLLECVSVYDRV